MELSTDNNLPEQKKRNEYPDVDEDPDEDKSLMPCTDSRRVI